MKKFVSPYQIYVLIVAVFAMQCNNHNLYESLANPGGSSVGREGGSIMRTVFVSSVATTGNFATSNFQTSWSGACSGQTGWAMADCACKRMAQAANLPPTPYVGWVSTAGDDMTCRIQNRSLTNCALPPGGPTWVDMMGRTIAQGYSQLFSGTLQNKIEYTELQSQTSTNTWTGTEVTGTAATNICSAWSDDTGGGTGRKGSTLDSDLNWTAAIDGACNGILPIYCFGLN